MSLLHENFFPHLNFEIRVFFFQFFQFEVVYPLSNSKKVFFSQEHWNIWKVKSKCLLRFGRFLSIQPFFNGVITEETWKSSCFWLFYCSVVAVSAKSEKIRRKIDQIFQKQNKRHFGTNLDSRDKIFFLILKRDGNSNVSHLIFCFKWSQNALTKFLWKGETDPMITSQRFEKMNW